MEATTPASRLARYRIRGLIGRGGMAVVWQAMDVELGRTVALKLLEPGHLQSDAARERLRREAQAMARLNHPNVAAILDIGASDDHAFIVMELMECTLRDWLEDEPRTWREALAVLIAAGRGLAAAHRTGVIHRDIKPDNVLLGRAGEVKVSDFGIAGDAAPTLDDAGRPVRAATEEAIAGTPRYMAPEYLRGRPADARSDQFSFCVMVWEALYGTPPFPPVEAEGVSTLARTIAGVTRGELVRGEKRLPRALERVLLRGLAMDPERRYPDMDALLADLTLATRRRRIGWAIAGIAAAAIAGTVTAALISRPSALAPALVEHDVMANLIDPTVSLVAMARDGETLAIARTGRPTVQLITTNGVERGLFYLPVDFDVQAIAIGARGDEVVLGGLHREAWELWYGRAGDTIHRIAILPRLQRTHLQVAGQPPQLAITTDQIVVARGTGLYAVTRTGAVRMLGGGRAEALQTRPGGTDFAILEVASPDQRFSVFAGDGTLLEAYGDLPGFVFAFDWIDRSHIAVLSEVSGTMRVLELELGAGGTIRSQRELGTVERPAIALYVSAQRMLAVDVDRTLHVRIGQLSRGTLDAASDAGWIGFAMGWLGERLLINGDMLHRHAAVSLSPQDRARVLFEGFAGEPIYVAGDRVVTVGTDKASFCGVRAYQRGIAIRTLDMTCTEDPRLFCAAADHGPCLLARWEGQRDVYRRFDPDRLAIGDAVFVDPEPAIGVTIDATLSFDGTRLVLPRATGGATIVDLANGATTEIARSDRAGWHSAVFSRAGLLVTTYTSFHASRILRVASDGSTTSLYESSTGVFGNLRVAPDGDMLGCNELTVSLRPMMLEPRR